MLRLAGKRELGQMSIIDLVVILIITNAVRNAMIGSDTSLTGGLVAAATLIVADHTVTSLALRSGRIGGGLTGEPTLLIHNVRLMEPQLRKESVTFDERTDDGAARARS